MKLQSDVRFTDEKIKEAFYKLKNGDDQERELFKLINQAMIILNKTPSVEYKYQRNKFQKLHLKL